MNLGGNIMKKLKVVLSRVLLTVMIVAQVFGTTNMTTVQASTSGNLESIIVSGGSFDTGIRINQNYSVEMTFSLSTLNQYKNLYIASGSPYDVYRLRYEANQGIFASHGWYNQKICTPKANEEITVANKKNVFYVNGKKVLTETYQNIKAASNLKFGDLAGSIKSFKVWNESGVLAASYVPALDENNKACMYDTVGKKYVYYSGYCKAGKMVEKEVVNEAVANEAVNETSAPLMTVPAADTKTAGQKAVYNILKESLVNNDASMKSIEKYNMSQDEMKKIWKEVQNDYFLESSASLAIICPMGKGDKVTHIYLWNADADYFNRLAKLKTVRDNFLKTVKPGMFDMDKVVLAHEYLVNNCEYSKTGTGYNTASGALVYGKANCAGYTRAMMFLLHYADIETEYMGSSAMNHAWVCAKVDGEWYHIDPTWDDTRKGANGTGMHKFLIRNDKEMPGIQGGSHYDWKSDSGKMITSTSEKYTKWFVHDAAGTMYYHNGLWYYVNISTGEIKASTIDGKNTKVIVNKSTVSGISKISGISADGTMKYCANGKTYTKKI